MIINYITKIKQSIHTSRKTANILDGSYKSIYKGRSMDFDDLRNYVVGDNIKDIDWKSSARNGNLLIRRFVAEKKHNILLVLDTGKKMIADTRENESKKEIALMSTGILAYLASQNGDYISAIYSNKTNSLSSFPFKYGIHHIETLLYNYDKDIENDNNLYIENVLEYISNNIKRKMIIFVITDLQGMEIVKESTLKKLSILNDILFINISDAYMAGANTYDIDNSFYIPELISKNTKLLEMEKASKEKIYSNCLEKFKKYKISTITIDNNKEITAKIADLLERHKHANIH